MKSKKRTERKTKCACGLKVRGPNHYEGQHHQAFINGTTNEVRKISKKK
jgi:hypothetical protein